MALFLPSAADLLLSPSFAHLLTVFLYDIQRLCSLSETSPYILFTRPNSPTVNMKFSAAAVAILASTVAAAPLAERATGTTVNELDNGGCRPYIMFHARGTGQAGNVVR